MKLLQRLSFTITILFILAQWASAQVLAQTPSFKLAWDQPETLAITQTFQYTLKVDNGVATALVPTCVAKGVSSACTAPLAAMSSGSHTLLLTVFNGFGSTAGDLLTGGPPSKPLSITVTVTVVIP